MGRNKALLEWQDKPLFRAMAETLTAAGAAPVLISANSETAGLYCGQNYGQTVIDRLPGRGPLSGIHAALLSIKELEINDESCLLVVPVDMPLLSAESLKHLADYCAQHQSACYFQDFTLPVCLPVNPQVRKQVDQAINSPDRKDYSIWRLLHQLDGKAIPLPAPEQATLFRNTNTPQEWQACQTFVWSQNIHKEYS
ncbi:hypothetical protein GZ77_07565 [Endozoicomonas montiporae]|uniref:MobA-like NTP transferase domain-containing protein n=2 Tax=Endozoicomonas montiporae TaxID=1027273 RepID=A0A081N739_9GAMM|nr:hypothetical protein GZ77_07565 [Endozoicomonas montiporae]